MTEWRPIPGFGGYEASADGRIRRVVMAGNGHLPQVLTNTLENNGYFSVCIRQQGVRRKTYSVHQLMCLAFHGLAPSVEHEVAHGDGTRTNNAPDNLRWATGKENAKDRRAHGRDRLGDDSPNAKLAAADIPEIFRLANGGMSQRKIARRFSVHQRTITSALHGTTWGHVSRPLSLRYETATPMFARAGAA